MKITLPKRVPQSCKRTVLHVMCGDLKESESYKSELREKGFIVTENPSNYDPFHIRLLASSYLKNPYSVEYKEIQELKFTENVCLTSKTLSKFLNGKVKNITLMGHERKYHLGLTFEFEDVEEEVMDYVIDLIPNSDFVFERGKYKNTYFISTYPQNWYSLCNKDSSFSQIKYYVDKVIKKTVPVDVETMNSGNWKPQIM